MQIAMLDSWIQTSAEGSGTAVGVGGLERALLAQGHQVTRLSPRGRWPRNLTLRRLVFNLRVPAMLRAAAYDLVIGVDIDGVRWARQPRRAPYVVSVKGVIAEELQHEQGRTRRLFQILARIEGHNARHADAVLTTSAYSRAAITQHYGVPDGKMRLVPEGIDLARWQRIAAQEPRSSNGATILCVARQYPRKHIADLLCAMPLVRRAVPTARAILIGDGPEHATLRTLAAELGLGAAVRFLGAIPDDDAVARLYRYADVFCLPSVQEGFGIVLLEAMASGLPIVATSAAAVPEVVPDQQAGLLVPPGDVRALAEALAHLLRRPERRAAFGAYAQQHVQQYDWRLVGAQFIAQVAPLLHERHGSTQRWMLEAGRSEQMDQPRINHEGPMIAK